MALLRASLLIAQEQRSAGQKMEMEIAHFDHRIRPDSADDATWVETEAARLGVPCHLGQAGRSAEAEASRESTEERARRQRYRFLQEVATDRNCRFVATGHTADDAAETVLFNILRGSGLSGAAGMPQRRRLGDRSFLIRPMLACSREQGVALLGSLGQGYREDPSNQSLKFTRNRLRHEVIPLLHHVIGPGVNRALLRFAAQADEASRDLSRRARRVSRKACLTFTVSCVRFDCRQLVRSRPLVLREMFVGVWKDAGWPRQRMSARHWQRLAELVRSPGRQTFPGKIDVQSRRNILSLSRE